MVSLTQDQNFWIFLCFGQGDIDVVGTSVAPVAGRKIPEDRLADCTSLDCTARPDYDPKSQAQPLRRESGNHDVFTLR